MTHLLFISGSTRTGSTNTKLATLAAKIAKNKGASVEIIDLSHYDMPIYNGDIEQESGLPKTAIALKEKMVAADGFFIASPEYNSSFSALLKNTIDWTSRKHQEDEPMLHAYDGKVIALGAAAPGNLGGLRGLVPLRMVFGNIGCQVIPNQVAVSNGFNAFDGDGDLIDDNVKGLLNATIDQLIATATKINA